MANESGNFRMTNIIEKKRDGHELTAQEVNWFIDRVVGKNGERCDDSQLGAILMAIFLKGMSPLETVSLTSAMTHSGESDILQWPDEFRGKLVDKHSTGGVGDKVSLALAPALAACGMKVPMISGRGLGHTGGTLDKLESIPQYKINLDQEEMKRVLDAVGCCIVGQSPNLVPADARMYKTRDVTATVKSTPLIVGSIICKKAAESIDALIIDVKCGEAAIAKTTEEGQKLAEALVNASAGQGIKTMALLTEMENPIGNTIGNALEVAEIIQCLHGHGPEDLVELVTKLGGNLMALNDNSVSLEKGTENIHTSLCNGTALKKFRRMLVAQGVDESLAKSLCDNDMQDIDDVWSQLQKAKHETNLEVSTDGYVNSIDGKELAIVSRDLGAGRATASDEIDHAVGIRLFVRQGSKVKTGDVWIRVYHQEEILPKAMIDKIQKSLNVGNIEVQEKSRVIDRVYAD